MYKLDLDATKVDEKSVCLYKDGSLIGELKGDVDIVRSIKDLLETNNLSPKDIDEFTYNKGPGSYTGLKVSSSVANTLNWILDRKNIDELKLPEYGSEPNISKPKKPQSIV